MQIKPQEWIHLASELHLAIVMLCVAFWAYVLRTQSYDQFSFCILERVTRTRDEKGRAKAREAQIDVVKQYETTA